MLGCLEANRFCGSTNRRKSDFLSSRGLLAPARRASDCSFDLSQILNWLCAPYVGIPTWAQCSKAPLRVARHPGWRRQVARQIRLASNSIGIFSSPTMFVGDERRFVESPTLWLASRLPAKIKDFLGAPLASPSLWSVLESLIYQKTKC